MSQLFEPMTHCWSCGRAISNPTIKVEEHMQSYGKSIGFQVTGVIHKSCAEEVSKQYPRTSIRFILEAEA